MSYGIVLCSNHTRVGYLHYNIWRDSDERARVSWQVGFRYIETTKVENGKLILLDADGDALDNQPNITVYKKITEEQYDDFDQWMEIVSTLFSLKNDETALKTLAPTPGWHVFAKQRDNGTYLVGAWEHTDIEEFFQRDNGTYVLILKSGTKITNIIAYFYAVDVDEAHMIMSDISHNGLPD